MSLTKSALLFAVATLASGLSGAQQVTAAIPMAQQPSVSATRAGTALSAILSVDLTDVTMKTALDEISSKSGVSVVYSHTIVPVNRRVTVKGANITLAAALRQALKGTGTEARVTPEGQVSIGKIAIARTIKGQGTVAGKVIDARTGRGVSGANVTVGPTTNGVTTGEDGSFRITGVGAGTHVISVRLLGYARQTRQIVVGESATVTADFKLEQTTNVLDQVIVTGTAVATELKAVPNAITVVTAKQLEERGITQISQLFRGDVPGVMALNSGSREPLGEVSMYSRGATAITNLSVGTANTNNELLLSNAIKTYVDGVELADSRYLNQIDPKSIERIEILTGPQASTIYGSNAINGVMQIFTKRGVAGARPQLVLDVSSSLVQNNFNSALAPSHIAAARLSGTEGRLSYSTGSSVNYTGAWTPGVQGVYTSVNAGGTVVMGSLTADLSAQYGKVSNTAKGRSDQTRQHLAAIGILNPASGRNPTHKQFRDSRTLGVTIGYAPFSWWSHELGLGGDSGDGDSFNVEPAITNPSDTIMFWISNAVSRSSQRYSTTARLPFWSSAYASLVFGVDHWSARGMYMRAEGASRTGSLSNPVIERAKPERNTGGFFQGQVGLSEALFLTYGLRAEWNPNYGEDAQPNLAPRYGAVYTKEWASLTAKFRGSYGRSTRPPNRDLTKSKSILENEYGEGYVPFFGLFDEQLANQHLGPEYQQGAEGGVELYWGNRGSISVTRYNQTVDELIFQVLRADSTPSLDPDPWGIYGLTCADFGQGVDADGHCYYNQSKYVNAGSIRNQGWELLGTVNIGPFTTRGTYSWTKSRILGITPRWRSELASYKPGGIFQFLAEHTWAMTVSYAKASTNVSVTFNGIGQLYTAEDFLNILGGSSALRNRMQASPKWTVSSDYRPIGAGYSTADLNASHRLSDDVAATFQVRNLTDYYRNDIRTSYPTAGRQTRLGVRWTL